MFKVVLTGLKFSTRRVLSKSVKRFFLSNAYKCEEVWESRLKNVIFQKVDPSSLYHELDLTFQKKERVSVLDVDILVNSIKNPSLKNELDDVLLRLRLCPECVKLPERSTHAVIRWYMQHASTEDLMDVLSDRLNYGLFPDYYLTIMLMDKYLKEKDSRSAVKIAVLQMLQEDFDDPIMKAFALHSCFNYLESSEIWEAYKEPEPDPEEEVVKVRVFFVRNPYFDDHFDIKEPNHLVGKTLWLFGRTVELPIGTSSQLVGLVLYEKYDECVKFLEEVIQKGTKIHAEAVEKAKEYLLKKPKQVDPPEPEKPEGAQADAKSENVDEYKSKVLELLEKIDQKNLINGSILSESVELVKEMLEKHENSVIENQCKVYKQWEKDREAHIQSEMERAERIKAQLDIEEAKKELRIKEERLFFFDREEEISLLVEEKNKIKESLVFYKGKRKNKESVAQDYIPPDVSQRKK